VDTVFAPSAEEMYPSGFATTITVKGPAEDLESVSRPHFFGGVATVVAKLLTVTAPDVALFGEKDYQQLLVIRRMATDLGIPVEIAGVPTVREADGLALSSRNAYLSAAERAVAPTLYTALSAAADSIRNGEPAEIAISGARSKLAFAGFRVDYLRLRNAETLKAVEKPNEPKRLLAAAWLGKTRLIDNVAV
jgi:pantoate--beta-alanine ligase